MALRSLKSKQFAALLFLSFMLAAVSVRGQDNIHSVGINTGLSSFESLSVSVSGIQFSAFCEFPVWFSKAFNLQAALFYIRKTEFFLPDESSDKYYPYFYGASISGIMRQRIKNLFFAEEQAGLLVLKNKFFESIDETNYGISFGLAGGIDLTNDGKGFLISIGYKGGMTFNASTPSFNSFLLQGQYLF